MAETKRMTAEQVVSYLLEGEEGLDFLRESLCEPCSHGVRTLRRGSVAPQKTPTNNLSDGLEPSTPSLPCAPFGNPSQPVAMAHGPWLQAANRPTGAGNSLVGRARGSNRDSACSRFA